MNKKERIAAAIAGERPDRLPYAFWGPGLTEPESAEIHAGLALDFQKECSCTVRKQATENKR